MTDIHALLDNWTRWARYSPTRYQSLLGQLYKASSFELENGEIVSRTIAPKIPVDLKDALRTEHAILKLPHEPYHGPRLIVYHYLYPWRDIHKECRKIGVKVYKYQETLEETLNRLTMELV